MTEHLQATRAYLQAARLRAEQVEDKQAYWALADLCWAVENLLKAVEQSKQS